MKKKITFITILLIIIVFIIAGIKYILPKKNTSTKKDMSTFSSRIEHYSKQKILSKLIKERLTKVGINTTKVYIKGIDIDSDNNLELIVYVKENKKQAIFILKENEKHNNLKKDNITYSADKVRLIYAYSKQDNKNMWYFNTNKLYYSINYGETNPFTEIKNFKDNTYTIEIENLTNYTIYDLNTNSFNIKELEKNSKSNEEIMKDNNLTQEKIKSKANS